MNVSCRFYLNYNTALVIRGFLFFFSEFEIELFAIFVALDDVPGFHYSLPRVIKSHMDMLNQCQYRVLFLSIILHPDLLISVPQICCFLKEMRTN
jgi:hypothetical protein